MVIKLTLGFILDIILNAFLKKLIILNLETLSGLSVFLISFISISSLS